MNEYIGVGRVTRDIKCTYTANNIPVARFTLAIDRIKQEGKADFIPVEVWNKQAEIMEKHVKKGEKILVTGSLKSGSYEDRNGNTVYTLVVNLNRFEFLEPKAFKDAKTQEHAQENQAISSESTNNNTNEHIEHQEELPDGYQYVDDDMPF